MLCGGRHTPDDAIFANSVRLARAMNELGVVRAEVLRHAGGPRWSLPGERRPVRSDGFDAYVLQYNPFSFARWGIAPLLPLAWARVGGAARPGPARSGRERAVRVVTVHEAHVPAEGVRGHVQARCQQAQLGALLAASDAIIATCAAREHALGDGAWRGRRPVHHIPAGSNLDPASDVAALRERLRGSRDVPIVATFGNAHPSRLIEPLVRTCHAVGERLGEHVMLNLGAHAPGLPGLPAATTLVTPGPLDAAELARHLACADLVLLPYVNGAITNRTTLMAALQHGLPVLSTRGPLTDEALIDPGLRLVAAADWDGFAAAAVELLADAAERESLGEQGRSLFERAFSWPVLASATVAEAGAHRDAAAWRRGRPAGERRRRRPS